MEGKLRYLPTPGWLCSKTKKEYSVVEVRSLPSAMFLRQPIVIKAWPCNVVLDYVVSK